MEHSYDCRNRVILCFGKLILHVFYVGTAVWAVGGDRSAKCWIGQKSGWYRYKYYLRTRRWVVLFFAPASAEDTVGAGVCCGRMKRNEMKNGRFVIRSESLSARAARTGAVLMKLKLKRKKKRNRRKCTHNMHVTANFCFRAVRFL